MLARRGLTSKEEIDRFLICDYTHLHSPFLLKDMSRAAARIEEAIERGELIAVYGDYDVDGITALVLLSEVIRSLGGKVLTYVPHRIEEGYGLNQDAVKSLAKQGVSLMVTVDCGISAVAEVQLANELGMSVIITDHHHPPRILPPAFAIINPRRTDCSYPFQDLAGVGVAFKLAQGLLSDKKARGSQLSLFGQPLRQMPLEEERLLDLVALGTVVDMVPLLGENRVLVKHGLAELNSSQRVGLQALIARSGQRMGNIDTEAVSYILGPRLNAAGRLREAQMAIALLMSEDLAEAEALADELEVTNAERQKVTQQVWAEARETILQNPDNYLHVISGKGWPAGVIGLVAGKLADEFYRPVLILEEGEIECRGSARSIKEFNIISALEQCEDILLRYGGHAQAAGLTISSEHLETLDERLTTLASQVLSDCELVPSIDIDCEVKLEDISWALFNELGKLAPFGHGNQEPLLMTRQAKIADARLVGENHLKVKIRFNAQIIDGIGFNLGDCLDDLMRFPFVDLVYSLQSHRSFGYEALEMNIRDMQSSDLDFRFDD